MARGTVAVDLEALRKDLQRAKDEERPERPTSLREAVGVLLPEIEGLRRAKWSDTQISEWLSKRGLAISPGTLAQYVREARKAADATGGDTKAKRSTKATGSDGPAAPREEAATVAERKPETAPKVTKAAVDTKPPAADEKKAAHVPSLEGATPKSRRVNDDA